MTDLIAVTKLYAIFSEKKWNQNEGHEMVFNNFCQLFLNLTEPQKKLIVELTQRYTWINFNDYNSRLVKILNKIEAEKIKSLKKIILFPIMKPEDEKKTKSGHTILYTLRALKPILSDFKHISFKEIESYAEIQDTNFKVNDNEAVFLLDDYLGSGETIKTTLTEIYKNSNIQPHHLNIITIATQKEIYDFIIKLDIAIYTDFVSSKGITDYYQEPELSVQVEIMKEIETMISGNHFPFGYNDSEAIITLMRTPDNTFPIFWKEYKKGREKFQPPFARY